MTAPTVWEALADKLTPPEPVSTFEWVRDHAKNNVWSKVQEICEAVEEHRRLAIYGCHSSSKTWAIGQVVLSWIDNAPIGKRRVVTTAPGGDQVKGGLWIELNRSHAAYGLPGRMTQTEWWIGQWQAGIGRKPAEWAPTSFQGLKAEEVLVVADEATGLEGLWEALESLASSKGSKLIAMGNPTDPNSTFAKLCLPGSGWHVIQIDAHDTPNWTGEDVPDVVRNSLISKEYAEGIERNNAAGKESPAYLSRVRGQWPEDATDGVIPFSWAKACQRLTDDLSEGPVELGLDVGASDDGDATVIREIVGHKVGRSWEIRTSDPEKIVGLAVRAINETGAARIKVDVIGVGFGIAGWIEKERKNKSHNAQVVKVNVAERCATARDRKRFKNKRAQLWWMGRELSQEKLWDLSGVSEECMAQLISPRYWTNSAGQTVVEEKVEIRKRTGRSPDDAEALLLAAWKEGAGPASATTAHKIQLPS